MPELIPIFLFLTAGAVLILRPITKRLGLLLEAIAEERRQAIRATDTEQHFERVAELLERLNGRLESLEDRVQFVERLGDARRPERLGEPRARDRHLTRVE